MIRIIITILILTLFDPPLSYGQKSEIHNKLSDAFDYGKKTNEYAASILNHIKTAINNLPLMIFRIMLEKQKMKFFAAINNNNIVALLA